MKKGNTRVDKQKLDKRLSDLNITRTELAAKMRYSATHLEHIMKRGQLLMRHQDAFVKVLGHGDYLVTVKGEK